MTNLIKNRIPELIFDDEYTVIEEEQNKSIIFKKSARGEQFRDFLIIKCSEFQERIMKTICTKHIYSMDNMEFLEYMLNLIMDGIKSYEQKAIDQGIHPELIKAFKSEHSSNEFMAIEGIKIACLSYPSVVESLYSIQGVLEVIFGSTIGDAQKVFKKLNGALNGYEYKGVKCSKR
jgi:hypothetical protein